MDENGSADPARECRAALELALARLRERGDDLAAYLVTGVASTAGGSGAWRVTFKPRRLLARGPDGVVGAGGEVFVNVDLASGEAVFRAGE